MTASADPKFFQVLPTRSLLTTAADHKQRAPEKASPSGRSKITQLRARSSSSAWTPLEERIRSLRPQFSQARAQTLSTAVQGTLEHLLREKWQHAQNIISQAAGDTLAIAIVGSLSETPAIVSRLLQNIDGRSLESELERYERDSGRATHVASSSVVPLLENLSTQELTRIEPALDGINQSAEASSELDYACTLTVRTLIHERCATLVAPVRMKIEKELSFEFSAPVEVTEVPEQSPVAEPLADDNATAARTALQANDTSMLIQILARAPGASLELADDAVQSRNARAITALGWKLGLPAGLTTAIQIHLALIPPGRAILPRTDGEYALTPREMNWQLDFLRNKSGPTLAA